VPDTRRNRAIRTSGRFIALAHDYEAAISAGDGPRLAQIEEQWDSNVAEKERQKADARERSSRTDLPFAD
jgi:hypothetical protein